MRSKLAVVVAPVALAALLGACRTQHARPAQGNTPKGTTVTTEGGGGSGPLSPGTAGAEVDLRGQRINYSSGTCALSSDKNTLTVQINERPDHTLALKVNGNGRSIEGGQSYNSLTLDLVDRDNRLNATSGVVEITEALKGGRFTVTDTQGGSATGTFSCGGNLAPGGG